MDSPEIPKLLPDLSSAVYAPPGYLVFVREGMLTAAPFDVAAGRVTGSPLPIGGTVATAASINFAAVSASADGTLAVRPPPAVALVNTAENTPNAELHLVDRSGASIRVGTAKHFSYRDGSERAAATGSRNSGRASSLREFDRVLATYFKRAMRPQCITAADTTG